MNGNDNDKGMTKSSKVRMNKFNQFCFSKQTTYMVRIYGLWTNNSKILKPVSQSCAVRAIGLFGGSHVL